MPTFDLICLANSYKHGGRCIAGLRVDAAGWIRPISPQPDGTLFLTDYILSDLTEVGPLDVFRVGVSVARSTAHQPENWVIDGTRWQLLARPMSDQLVSVLQNAIVPGPELLRGSTDRVAYSDIRQQPLASSLALVVPESLEIVQQTNNFGKRHIRGRFSLGATPSAQSYDLPVTDPTWVATVRNQGHWMLRQADVKFLVTISISEPFNLQCYKLIATVIPLPAPLASKF